MTEPTTKRASLSDIRLMKNKGELYRDAKAPEGESLGADFWAQAKLESPKKPRSVHLKLDAEVFDFFVAETGGKGHITRMQAVLKAYAKAQRTQ